MLTPMLLALAVLAWPAGSPLRSTPARARRRPVWSTAVALPVVCASAWLLAGPPVALAATLLVWTMTGVVTGLLLERSRARAEDRAEQAVGALLRELRAGATPEAALQAVTREFPDTPALAAVLTGTDDPDPVARRLRDSAALSTRLGLPWSGVLAAVVDDLRVQARIRVARSAAMAGPRLSGWVLSALPLVGIGLGYGMGTDPVQVLVHSGMGQILLLVGVTLTCAGLWWVRRIAR